MLPFGWIGIHLGNSMVYITHLLGFARVEENALSERGFSGIYVSDDAKVALFSRLISVAFQRSFPPFRGMVWLFDGVIVRRHGRIHLRDRITSWYC